MALTYENVVDDSILLHFEAQNAFADFVTEQTGGGSEEVKVDLAKQQITFIPKLHKRDELVCRAHLIGSVAADPHSAMWGWNNPQFVGQPIVKLSERIRGFGESNGIAELSNGEIPLPDETDTHHAANRMAAVGCRITGMPVAHIVGAGSTAVVFALDPVGFTLGQPDGVSFPRVVIGPIQEGGWVNDHRRAVQGYAQARSIPHGWAPGFTGIQLRFPEGPVTVDFDEQGRVSHVNAQLSAPEER